jgi:tetratricopeptide (TPR) repeat protein
MADIRGEEESKLKLAPFILTILLMTGFALAHETVCPSGCDSTGIQAAVYAAHSNDTIDVYSGTYNESVVLTKDVTFSGIDTGSGEPIVNGDLYQNGFNMVLRGFGFQSVSPDWADAENMTTKNTTFYWIEKAFENPSKSKAIADLDKIIKANPKETWALYRKGWVLSDTGRYDESTDILKESIKSDPYFASPWNSIGNNFWTLKKYDKALEAYEKATQLRPNKGLYWFNKGDALKELGRTGEAEAAYAKASRLGYGNFTSINKAASIGPSSASGPTPAAGTFVKDHIMASNIDESTSNVIAKAYTFSNTDSGAYSWLSLGKAGNNTVKWMWYSPDGNLYRTERVDVPAPSDAYWRSYDVWSHIYIVGNNAASLPGDWHVDVYLDGQKVFTEYFSIFGDQPTAAPGNQSSAPVIEQTAAVSWLNQGIALGNLGKYDEAVQAFDKAIEINPKNAVGWYLKGAALDRQGKVLEAIQACNNATEINPQDADAWYIKGKVLEDLGRYDEAMQAFDNSTQIDPQNIDAWYDKGEELYWQGKYNESIQALDKVTEIDPQDADAWYIKSMALDDLGKQEEAGLAYNRSIEINPDIEEEWWG